MKIHRPAPPQNIHSQEAMDIAQKNAIQRHAAPLQEKQDEEKEYTENTLGTIGQNSRKTEAPNDNPGQLKQEASQMSGITARPNTRGFVDNRPEAIQMRKWQEMSDNSARSIQMRKWQEMSDNSDRSIQMRKLQEMADNSPRAAEMREMQQKAKNYDQNQMNSFFSPEPLQRKEEATDTGSGSKMPEEVQAKMESAFGADFSNVNIHVGEQASSVGALAYAQGNDIHFAPGQYNPNTQSGQELLGHELTHVVQQRAGRVQTTTQAKGLAVNDDPALEQEADVMGKKAAKGENATVRNSLQSQSIQKTENLDSQEPWTDIEDTKVYIVSDTNPIIREFQDNKFEKTNNTVTRWLEVRITKKSNDDKYVYIINNEDSSEIGWTSLSNLYDTKWDPKDHKDEYENISTAYANQMLQNDPIETIADLKLSGSETKSIIDKYFKNSNDVNDLDSSFKSKYEDLKQCFEANDMTVSATAGLRHPLRSLVFNYAIKVRDAADENIIYEANAVSKKYGVPIDWIHKKDDGSIDLSKSKSQANIVCQAFGLGSAAARGIKDFGGTISNHNSGKAVDAQVTFGFSEAKEITYNGKTFTVNPVTENLTNIPNINNSGLTLLGKEASGLQRNINNDPVHWSITGN
jgi:hypothetical protein